MASAPKANAAKSAKLKNIEAIYPLSPMQEGMLFHTLMSDDTGIYLMQDRYQVQGHIEAEAYAQAWQKVVDTHPALRTSFAWKSTPKPVQIVHRKTQVPMAVGDLRHLDSQQQEQQIQDWLAEERQQGFDMSKPQLIRFRLVRLGDERFEFIRSFHHILMDAWCISLVTMDFLRHYEAIRQGTSIEIPAPRPYRDYIQWLQKQDHDKAKQFWQQRLAGFNEPTALMIDDGRHQQGQTQGHYAPASVANVQQRFSRAESDALSRFARHAELTLNTVVQGAWSLLLSHYSGSQDVVFGVTVSGRPSQLDAVEEIIGLFINTLPLRVQVPPHQPLKAWLKAIQRNNLEQREFEHTPLVEIQEWAETPKGKALFDSLVVFENAPVDIVLKQQGFSFDVADMEHRVHTNYPITLVLMPEDELGVQITYDEALFEADAVARMLQHLMQLLRQMLAQPEATLGELNPLSGKEQQQLQHWAHSEHQFPVAESWQQAFEQQAAQQAEAIAVSDGTETLSYAQLNDDANRIAHALIKQGVQADDTIAIYGPRNANYLRMIAGILKAGAAYVPLDIHHPQQRIEQILAQSGARLALHSQDHELSFDGEWIALSAALSHDHSNNPECRVQANNLAYVIYTSGSTGTPKGVMVQQQGMLNNILGKVPALGISKDDVIAQTASPCFDISVWQFLAAPALGARVEILVDDIAKDPYRLAEAVEARDISLLEIVPALMPGLIDSEHRLESLRWVLPTGEALPNALCQRWFEHFNIPLMNAYGPAECSDDVAFQPLHQAPPPADTSVAIGQATANNRLYVLNQQQQALPVGVVGEIAIAGTGVGRGYVSDARRTALSFVPNPFSDKGERLYLTGDLGRWNEDGILDYVGRLDQQVKIRGHRIELGEVEAVLEQLSGVERAAVITRADSRGDLQLLAFVEAPNLDVDSIKKALSEQLPNYMVPQGMAVLEQLPLNANGKVDRRNLPDIDEPQRQYQAPQGELEAQLAQLWQDLLNCGPVGRDDNFFELGGHSLLATQVLARIRQQLKVELSLRTVFESNTIVQLAQAIEASQQDEHAEQSIPTVSRKATLPLSYAQQRLWFLDQLEANHQAYNIVNVLDIQGQLDVHALQRSFDTLVQRHEILRTTFVPGSGQSAHNNMSDATASAAQVQQCIHTEMPVSIHHELIGSDNTVLDDWGPRCQQAIQAAQQQDFDLRHGPLLAVRLLQDGRDQQSQQRALLIVSMHHIIADAWSLAVLTEEISTLYLRLSGQARNLTQGQVSALPDLSIQYADYAHWQRQQLQGQSLDQLQTYWHERLAQLPAVHELPLDYPRPARQSYRGETLQLDIDAQLSQQLKTLAQAQQCSLFMLLQTVFAVLLARQSHGDDIVMGTPLAGRQHTQLEGLIGFFVNTLVLRTSLADNPSFIELLQQNRQHILGAYEHQAMPFELLVETLQPKRSLSYSPLFQVLFSLQNHPRQAIELPDLRIEQVTAKGDAARYDLALDISEEGDTLCCYWEYNSDLFSQQRIQRMMRHYRQLLHAVAQQPQQRVRQLPMLTAAETQQLQHWAQGPSLRIDHLSEHWLQRFTQHCQQQPEHPALICEGQSLSYAALDQASTRLARKLRQQVGETSVVADDILIALLLERNQDLLIALLAVMKAGYSYVPLDPSYPQQRIAMIFEDAQPALILGHESALSNLEYSGCPSYTIDQINEIAKANEALNLAELPTPSALAYTIFTSGSTGRPKGVQIEHAALNNFLLAMEQRLALASDQRWLALTTIAFDIAALELYLPLLLGDTLVMASQPQSQDPQAIQQLLNTHRISVVQATPATWRMLLNAQWPVQEYPHLVALSGGEALSCEVAQQLQPHVAALWNLYGPTETTIWSAARQISSEDLHPQQAVVDVGEPIANTQLYVLDPWQQMVPVGVAGELHIAGDGLARGYLNQDEKTAQQFINAPNIDLDASSNEAQDKAQRWYKTGDLVRYQDQGLLGFLGRIDHQVKLRGFRIELGEIESALRQQDSVAEAVVLIRSDDASNNADSQQLVAFLQWRDDTANESQSINDLREGLAQQLPHYMLPNRWQVLSEFPLTPNGKIDRRALAALALDQIQNNPGEAPEGAQEQLLASVWQALLPESSAPISRQDNFFMRGGHSLLATQMQSILREQHHYDLPLTAIFQAQDLAGMAAHMQATNAEASASIPALVRDAEASEYREVLSFAQQRMWVLEQLEPGQSVHHLPMALMVEGELNLKALNAALQALVERHDSLRTDFILSDAEAPADHALGIPQQRIHRDLKAEFALEIIDADHDSHWQEQVQQQAAIDAQQMFDLSQAPLLRSRILQRSDKQQHYALLFTLHHLVADGSSLSLMLNDFMQLYRQFAVDSSSDAHKALATITHSYADYSAWQRLPEQQEHQQQQLAFWQQALGQEPAYLLSMPSDQARPAQANHDAEHYEFVIDADLNTRLQQVAKASGVTVFSWLMSTFNLLLKRYTQADEIRIGTPVAGRQQLSLQPIVGSFVNTLVIQNQWTNHITLGQALSQMQEAVALAQSHQEIPFERIVDAIDTPRDLSYHPLFQVFFSLEDDRLNRVELPGSRHRLLTQRPDQINFDLALNISEETISSDHRSATQLTACFSFRRDLYRANSVAQWAKHFVHLLERWLAYYEQGQQERSIAELSCLSEAEGHGLIHDWNQNHAPIHDNSHLLTQYEQQVAHRPDAIALRYRNEQGELQSLSYRELDQRANRLAHELIAKGIQNEVPVGLCVHRHSALLVGVLAILKAGGCYVPLDPNYPQARLSATIEQAQIHYVLTEASLLPEHIDLLPQAIDQRTVEYIDISKSEAFSQYPETRPEVSRHAKQLAYVIFTSGSTGKPKGVAVEHRSAQNFLQAMQDKLHLQAGHHWLAVTSLAFDISVLELFLPIQQGACVVLANYEDARDGQRLANLISNESISHMQATPISWKLLLAEPNALQAANLTAVVGGEALPADLADALLPHVRCLWNCYGPTETTVWSSIYPVRPSSQRAISIGEPLLNNRLYVLDDQLKPVPLGVAGELYIGGDSLARSYWQRADLSAQQFIPDPYSTEDGARMYRTGDLVCRRHDGLLDYLGRSDQQVKVNGHRIELGDIEYHLKQWHEITDAAVQVQRFQQQQRLIAFVVANDLDTDTLDETALRQTLRQQLPEYMQPAQYVVLDALPLTANGKLNRKALPPVDLHQGEAKQAPTNEVEQFLLEQLQAVLSTDTSDDPLSIGIHDNFFALGGDSISAVQLVQRIKAQGWTISPRDVFVHQSIAELAEALQAQPKHFPLSPAQQQWLTFAPNATQTLYWYAIHAPRKYSAEQWQQAWQQLQQRHDSLRLRFVTMQGQDGQPSIQQSFDGNATFRHEERIEAEQLPTQSEVSAQLWFAKAHGRQRSHSRSGDQIYLGLNPLVADEASVQQLQSELLALVAEDVLPASGPSFNDWLNTAPTAIQHAWPQANSEHEQAPYHAPLSAGLSLNDEQQQALSENKLNLLEAAQACWHYVTAQHHNDTQAPSIDFETYLERPGRHNDAFEENWQDCIGAFAYPQRLHSFSAQQVSAQQDWAHIIEQVKQSRQDPSAQQAPSGDAAHQQKPMLLRQGKPSHALADRYAAAGFTLKLQVWAESQHIQWLWEAQQNCWSAETLQAYFDDFESAWHSLLEHLMSDQEQSLSAGDFPFAKQLNQDALAAVMAQLQGQSAPNNDPAANAASNAVKEKQA